MIKEIIESFKVEETLNKKVTLKWNDVFGVKDMEDLVEQFNLEGIFEENVIHSLYDALFKFYESRVEALTGKEVYAVSDISVLDGKLVLNDWETFDEEGNDRDSTPDEVKATIKDLEKSCKIKDAEVEFDGGIKVFF